MEKQYSKKWMKTSIRYCGKKVIYDKKTAITAKNKRYHDDRVELRIYPCPRCKSWHLTSKVRTKEKEIWL